MIGYDMIKDMINTKGCRTIKDTIPYDRIR